MNRELTREEALRLHRQMWKDMQSDLGDNPSVEERDSYKARWCEAHFPEEYVRYNCFLCEYATGTCCTGCPIIWPHENDRFNLYCCGLYLGDENSYGRMPISKILALPERSEDE